MSNDKNTPPNQPVLPSTPQTVAPAAVLQAASSYAGITLKPAPYDPAAAQTALDALRARLNTFEPNDLSVPRLDVRAAALAALAVHAFVTQVDAIHTRFEKLATIGEFDLKNIGDLKDAAFVVIYTHGQAETAGAFQTDAKVPVSLIKEGMEVEARMQELCEYKFKRDPEIAPQLTLLSPGTGHRDLATDLLGYAAIYAARPNEVASDTTNYRPDDAKEARRIAGEILSCLSAAMTPKARAAYDDLQRSWTLLLQIYNEVREVGLCMLRYDPARNERFPSLFAVGRPGRSRKKKTEPAGAEEGGAAGER